MIRAVLHRWRVEFKIVRCRIRVGLEDRVYLYKHRCGVYASGCDMIGTSAYGCFGSRVLGGQHNCRRRGVVGYAVSFLVGYLGRDFSVGCTPQATIYSIYVGLLP